MKSRNDESRLRILWIMLTVFFLLLGILMLRTSRHRAALCFETVSLLVLYGVVAAAFDATGYLKKVRQARYTAIDMMVFVAITLVLEIIVFRKVANERFIYYWDYSGWWVKAVTQSRALYADYREALAGVYQSVLTQDYNSFVTLFTALPVLIVGETYPAFVMILHNIFAIPTALVIACAGERLCAKAGLRVPWLLCYFVASLCPAFLYPVTFGFADVFALLLAALLMLLAVEFDWNHPHVSHIVLIGLMIPMCLAARRYFAFFLVGYVVMLALSGFVSALEAEAGQRRKALFRAMGAYALIGLISLVVFATALWGLLIRSINNNFAVAYSAYNKGDLARKFLSIADAMGGVYIAIALIGTLVLLLGRCRGMVIGMLAGVYVACMAFFRIQSMSMQHYYIVLPFVLPLACACFGGIYTHVGHKMLNAAMLCAGCVLLAGNMAVSTGLRDYLPESISRMHLFATAKIVPLQRNDLGVIQSMIADLKDEEGAKYVLASSAILNDDTLHIANYPLEDQAVKGLCNTADVDLRDGFPTDFDDAQIVLVAEPVQVHLNAKTQRVVTALAAHFIDGTLYARHYEEEKTYQLDGGVVVRVFRKIEPWTQEDYDLLREEFNGYYPDYPELFADRIHP